MTGYSWTQPCCPECWIAEHAHRQPAALEAPEVEVCVYCGQPTAAGIYVRLDPAQASYPTLVRR